METNKKDIILKIISASFTIILNVIAVSFYYTRLLRFTNIPSKILSIVLLFAIFMFVLYKIIFGVLKLFVNKKIIRASLLIILIILSVLGICYIKNNINYLLRNVVLMLIFILGVVCLPLIILGMSLINNGKFKVLFIGISIILLIYNYCYNFVEVMQYAQNIVDTFSNESLENLFSLREKEEKIDTTYLENYTQKYAKNGYLSQFDIKSILDIIDSKSMKINVNYKDEVQKSYFKITNKDDSEIQELKNSLKADFYKFAYEIKDNVLSVNIERYVIDKNTTSEKNEEIIISGNPEPQMVECKDKYFTDENSMNYTFENELVAKNEIKNRELTSFKILIAYDENTQNYVPVLDNLNDYELIKSYKVYNSGIELTLENNVKLINKDYTLRINRYDDYLNLRESWVNTKYYYEYEPVVEEMMDSDERTVLSIRFDTSYTVRDLNNIEIIFGK